MHTELLTANRPAPLVAFLPQPVVAQPCPKLAVKWADQSADADSEVRWLAPEEELPIHADSLLIERRADGSILLHLTPP